MAIKNVREGVKTQDSVTVLWDTDEVATTALKMKPGTAGVSCTDVDLTEQPAVGAPTTIHSYLLENLAQGSYCVHPISADRNGTNLLCASGEVCLISVSPTAPPPPTDVDILTLTAVPNPFPKAAPTQVTATATTTAGVPVPDQEVEFSLDHGNSPPSNHGQFGSTTVMTGPDGKAKTSFTAARTGTIHIKAEADNKVARLDLRATN